MQRPGRSSRCFTAPGVLPTRRLGPIAVSLFLPRFKKWLLSWEGSYVEAPDGSVATSPITGAAMLQLRTARDMKRFFSQ